MPYAAASKLTAEDRNNLLGYRVRLNGTGGTCFIIGDTVPGIWMTEIDVTIQLPDTYPTTERDGYITTSTTNYASKTRNELLIAFLQAIGTVPYENSSYYEGIYADARLAIEDYVYNDIRDLHDADILDEMRWNFQLGDADECKGFTVAIMPVFRSGEPKVRNCTVVSYNCRLDPAVKSERSAPREIA